MSNSLPLITPACIILKNSKIDSLIKYIISQQCKCSDFIPDIIQLLINYFSVDYIDIKFAFRSHLLLGTFFILHVYCTVCIPLLFHCMDSALEQIDWSIANVAHLLCIICYMYMYL